MHGPSPERFFAQCARLVKPGGLLVVCDDVGRPSDDIVDDSELQTCLKRRWMAYDLVLFRREG